GPVAGGLGALPGLRRHDRLRPLARGEVGPELHRVRRAAFGNGNLQDECAARVMVPDLHRINPVPMRALAAGEQKIDRGRAGAALAIAALIAKHLAIIAAFRVRSQLETRDDVGSARFAWHQDLFLRSRSSPNTSAGLAPFICNFTAICGSSARRNTFDFFSSPSSTGIVGLFSARSLVTCSARAVSAGLSASTVNANLTLEAVYSWPQ